MIEEQARVVRVDGDLAEILIHKQSACGSCSAKSGCGTSLLANWFPQRRLTLRLNNRINARAGDMVVLGLDEATLQRSSLMLYAVPLAGLLLAAIAGERGFEFLGLSKELGAVLSGLLGLTAALLYVRGKSRAIIRRGDGGVRLLRLVQPAGGGAFAPVSIGTTGNNQTDSFGTNK